MINRTRLPPMQLLKTLLKVHKGLNAYKTLYLIVLKSANAKAKYEAVYFLIKFDSTGARSIVSDNGRESFKNASHFLAI